MNYIFYLIFGLAPSLIWLLYFLRKDVHPEPKWMVLKIFFYGMLIALPAALLELGISAFLVKLNLPSILILILYIFLGIALVEETLKYLVVKEKVLKNPEFDEPIDAMLYMIIVALGFAATENVLILFSPTSSFQFFQAFSISALRFVGATFLHALCSGLLGFFLALSFFETKKREKLIISGLASATFLHGLYNYSIMEIEGYLKFLIPVIILISLAIAVSVGFQKVKKLASVCKIK